MRQIIHCIVLVAVWLCSMASAHAQCAATDKIYIDPRLVPKPLDISKERMTHTLSSPYVDPLIKQKMLNEYMQKGQPIVVPYGTGKVLVHQPILVFSNTFRDPGSNA